MYTADDLVQRTGRVYVTEDGRFLVTDLALFTSRRKGFRVADTSKPGGELVGVVKSLGAAVKLINEYVRAENAGLVWPCRVRRSGLP